MRIYLDDDSIRVSLIRLLTAAGHELTVPADVGLSGEDDPVHLRHSIRAGRVLLTHNYKDFNNLHELVMESEGHHPGILVVRRDNDPSRDMTPKAIVRAIRNLEASQVPIADCVHILNHWR